MPLGGIGIRVLDLGRGGRGGHVREVAESVKELKG